MKILLISDSHGYTHNIIKAINKNSNIDMIIHLGDFVKDIIKIQESYKNYQYEFVRGNNDWTGDIDSEKIIHIGGKKILITHGHLYNVKNDYQRIILKGKSSSADAVFFGHTHQTEEMFADGMMLLNPGSISLPLRSHIPTCCIVDINNEKIVSRFIGFE
ncbi:MAG: metallophosphoesterase [Clostridia bacterium]|nr:metallophosphoesterase [Clostridia bacterium]